MYRLAFLAIPISCAIVAIVRTSSASWGILDDREKVSSKLGVLCHEKGLKTITAAATICSYYCDAVVDQETFVS